MDNKSFEAGKAMGQTQEKTSTLLEKAGNAAVSVKDGAMGVGMQVHSTAQGAVEAVKNAAAPKK